MDNYQSILNEIDPKKEPIENAKTLVNQFLKWCEGMPDDEKAEKLSYMLAMTIRENPIPNDMSGYDAGIFIAVQNEVLEVRVHGSKERLMNILMNAFENNDIRELISHSLMIHQLKSLGSFK